MIVSGHDSCLGTNVSGHKRVWAQSCGPNHVWAQTWWNQFHVFVRDDDFFTVKAELIGTLIGCCHFDVEGN